MHTSLFHSSNILDLYGLKATQVSDSRHSRPRSSTKVTPLATLRINERMNESCWFQRYLHTGLFSSRTATNFRLVDTRSYMYIHSKYYSSLYVAVSYRVPVRCLKRFLRFFGSQFSREKLLEIKDQKGPWRQTSIDNTTPY
jgi:hypothetical protein